MTDRVTILETGSGGEEVEMAIFPILMLRGPIGRIETENGMSMSTGGVGRRFVDSFLFLGAGQYVFWG